MKRHLLYIVSLLALVTFTACSTDPEDAVSKHVYSESESPYLRTDTSANIAVNAEFRKGYIVDKTIQLKKYAEKIQTHLGMTVDDMLAGLETGKVVFYNIDVNRGAWNKTPQNVSGGWGYKADGLVSDTAQVATVTLDKQSKSIVLYMPKDSKAGVSLTANVGFSVNNGRDYDHYVRLNINMAVSDPSVIIKTVTIPSGDYATYELSFSDKAVEKAIEICFGMTVKDFNEAVQSREGDIAMYMIDDNGNRYQSAYTAEGLGYWCDKNGKPHAWGDGCMFFVETHDGTVGIGRYPKIASGSTSKVHFVYASKTDVSKFMEFVITANYE